MSVVVIMVKHKKAEVEIRINIFAEIIGGENDADFFEKHYGKGKLFTGGPTCNFVGKEVPCMVCWSENGSITCEILDDIFRTLDIYELFPRQPGFTPFDLMDANGSRI